MFGYEGDGVSQFERVASCYDSVFGRRSRVGHATVMRHLPGGSPGRVLDVGCGTGTLLSLLADHYGGACELCGVDAASAMIEQAKIKLPGCALLVGAAEALPLEDADMDLIVSSESIGHWADRDRGLSEVARVLKPGAQALVVEHRPPAGLRRALYYTAGKLPRYLSPDETADAARRQGFAGSVFIDGGYVVTLLRKVSS